MTTPDNNDRAEWARAAVEQFRAVCRGSPLDNQDGWDEACGDLIADMMHLMAKEGLDPTEVIERGVRAYMDERDFDDAWAPDNAMPHCDLQTWRGPL